MRGWAVGRGGWVGGCAGGCVGGWVEEVAARWGGGCGEWWSARFSLQTNRQK